MKKTLIMMVAAAMMLASCHSTKKTAQETTDVVASQTTTVGSNASAGSSVKKDSKANNAECLTAKVKVSLKQGEMDIATNGTLRMRRDDVIQLVLVDPFLGVSEVGRLEISPDNLLIIDRMNKRYVNMRYDDYPQLSQQGINFGVAQDYVWDEVKKKGTLHYTIPSRHPLTLDVKVGDTSNAGGWDGHTIVSDKYTEVSAETLFKSLMQ